MAGALSLEQDILALVEKHRGVALPEHLLARLAEESRLLAVREQIRSLHEADPFGLFSDTPSNGDAASEEEEEDGETKDGNAEALPENVEHMLRMMKITRFDSVTALSGFTSIDAEVEFSSKRSKGPSPLPPPTTDDNDDNDDDKEDEERGPVHLVFRFRREPMSKNAGDSNTDDHENNSETAFERRNDQPVLDGDVEVIDMDGEMENMGVVATSAAPESGTPSKVGIGNANSCEGGRKRVCLRTGESDGGGGNKGRKRPKGTGDGREDEEEEGKVRGEGTECGKESCDVGCCDDGSEQSDGESLGFEPRTLVSYTISGGIDYEPPEVLLQAVVYARGDGPACVMPLPEGEGERGDNASLLNDQEDVFDCNVDGPALTSIGRALGLHTEPSTSSDSERNSSSDSDTDKEGLDGMAMSDLVWWIMLFPFFEREFDMVEVVASSVFGEDDDSDSDDGECGSEGVLDDGSGDGGSSMRVRGEGRPMEHY